MEVFKEIIIVEESRLNTTVEKIQKTLAQEGEDRQKNQQKIKALKQKQLAAEGWREKREIGEEIVYFQEQKSRRLNQETAILKNPYFGILEIKDDDLGYKSYCLGRQSFFDNRNQVLVIDWREAPISRLYYEYEAGEEYEEEIRGRERSGTISVKRQVDTGGSELRKIMEKGVLLVRREDNSWERADGGAPVSRKEGQRDHRLPEITSLISGEQFRAITHPESRTIVLQGGAGSGKTTVGLHRIAYLAYQNPERFCPKRLLVVMFNRSLQKYISRVLPELGVKPGVQVETFHSWVGKIFHQAGLSLAYAPEAPAEVTRLKKHPLMLKVIDAYIGGLLDKSRQWLQEELDRREMARLSDRLEAMEAIQNFPEFLQWLQRQQASGPLAASERWQEMCSRLLTRLADHKTDLYMMFTDRQVLEEGLAGSSGLREKTLNRLIRHQKELTEGGRMDFADAGIVLRLRQCQGYKAALPDYTHIMVDEAQDLSQVELATLLTAADKWQSITICGDMAQKIKEDVTFEGVSGFADFIGQQQKQLGAEQAAAQTLMVGYRATRPIMELAWKVLGETGSLVTVRDGSPVKIIRTQSYEESLAEAKNILEQYRQERPHSLVAVVCRYIKDVDRLQAELRKGRSDVRRHAREDFSFQPGIVITNAHQVKGLEFSAVMVMNPSKEHYRDDRASRMLLHVVLTRASDRLWVIGHQPMAYGIEEGAIGEGNYSSFQK
jgi:DNA helicase-2/ATP-dependent DNA helicase PcrA